MPSQEAVDFLNRFKAYLPEVQKKANLGLIAQKYPDLNVDVLAKRFGIERVDDMSGRVKIRYNELVSQYQKDPGFKPPTDSSEATDYDKISGTYYGLREPPQAKAYRQLGRETGLSEFEIDTHLGRKTRQQIGAFTGGFAKGAYMDAVPVKGAEERKSKFPITSAVGEFAGMVLPITGISKAAALPAKHLPKLTRPLVRGAVAGGTYKGIEQGIQGDINAKDVLKEAALWSGLEVGGAVLGKAWKLYKLHRVGKKLAVDEALKAAIEGVGGKTKPLEV